MILPSSKIPVTVLTGYLGAGKTTLLNRILSEPHGQKYAVIVNEFGEIGIDNDLIIGADEEVFEMSNGCICCTVRGDLIRVIEGLMKRRGKFDAILVETTGLADPAPVAQTFFVDEEVSTAAKLDAVITVVDAKFCREQLKDAPEAKNQIAFADVIVLNKTDLVSADDLAQVRAVLQSLNPYARLIETQRGAVALKDVLQQNAFDLERILEIAPEFLEAGHHHHHRADVGAFAITHQGAVSTKKFLPWISSLTQTDGPDLLRCKGIMAFENEPLRYVFQGVHMMLEGDTTRPWQEGEARQCKLVFIGRNLDEARIRASFREQVAG